ncbi:hypothetical protein O6H91_Y530800 [Diphasiastrum complanatum]|nr:hypothetical protein O6H91_Y552800 [Diphasiastrum complanatum]KAJ7298608.1 hypothetical protein O6H91_Y530800 [Diphasiastrum complanatum]
MNSKKVGNKSQFRMFKSKALLKKSLKCITNLTAHFDFILSNLNEEAASQEQHQGDGSINPMACREIFMPSSVEEFSLHRFVRYSFHTLKVATNNFATKNEVGCGGTATVFKGVLIDGKRVAVKKFNLYRFNCYLNCFLSELEALGLCEHPNIVRLYGYCKEEIRNKVRKLSRLFRTRKDSKEKNESVYALVLEYMEKKNVAYFLFGDGN